MTRHVVPFLFAVTGAVALAACLGTDPRAAEPQAAATVAASATALSSVTLPAGFRIDDYATGVRNARGMARGTKGTVFVGSRSAGNVYALVDANNDQKADRVVTIATGLNMPSGVAFRDGALFVAEVNRILRYDGIEDALDAVPAVWRASLPGTTIVYAEVDVRRGSAEDLDAAIASFGDASVIGARVSDGSGIALTDLVMDEDGCTRFVVIDVSLTGRQAGRLAQRLLEIETYRMMALLGQPVAKEVGPWLFDSETRLAALMDRIGKSQSAQDEREILAELSALAARVEHSVARTTFRFGASRAYHGLVMQRIEELRERRISGLPTFHEFMQRRLLPAMNTCEAISRRQEELSARIARNSQLLRTRVDIELERQNQELLGQMNSRAKLQLRLQETVEGLSVVVLTYYGSQLVQYLAKGTKDFHHLNTDMITAISIPVIAGVVAWGTRRMRKKLAAEESEGAH